MDDLYIVKAGEVNRYKIGRSGSMDARFASMITNSPVSLKIVLIKKGEGYREPIIHKMFADERLHGEWFKASARLLKFIHDESIKNVPSEIYDALPKDLQDRFIEWMLNHRRESVALQNKIDPLYDTDDTRFQWVKDFIIPSEDGKLFTTELLSKFKNDFPGYTSNVKPLIKMIRHVYPNLPNKSDTGRLNGKTSRYYTGFKLNI